MGSIGRPPPMAFFQCISHKQDSNLQLWEAAPAELPFVAFCSDCDFGNPVRPSLLSIRDYIRGRSVLLKTPFSQILLYLQREYSKTL